MILRLLAIVLSACVPTRIVVEQPPITIVVPAPQQPRCDDVERVLLEDEMHGLVADAGPITAEE